jgi:hypothetical protein
MLSLRARALLVATVAALIPGVAAAQFPPPPAGGGSPTVQDRWPEPAKPPQAEPLQKPAQDAAPPKRKPGRSGAWINDDDDAATATPGAAGAAPRPAPRAPPNVVACNGVFAKDSGHLKLAIKFDSRNVVYSEVDGPDGTRINASVIYPNDPKRRLEVLWNNEGARTDTSVIAINGKSQWGAPKGMKLGMSIQQLEKLNGKAFRLSGFGTDGSSSVIGWEGGALSSLPGGCKIGVRLTASSKAAPDARATVGGDKELVSSDANVRAVQPAIAEILIGY